MEDNTTIDPIDVSTDPIGWQAAEIVKLKHLAAQMGWTDKSKAYKDQLKWIQRHAATHMMVEKKEGKKVVWPKIKKWVHGTVGKFADKAAAKVALLENLHAGMWVQDVASANSFAEDGLKAYRFVNKQAVGGPYLARLVDLDGKGTKWRVDTPHFVSEDPEDSEPEVTPAPAAATATSAGAKKNRASKATEDKEAEDEVVGKRRRR